MKINILIYFMVKKLTSFYDQLLINFNRKESTVPVFIFQQRFDLKDESLILCWK